MEQPTPMLVNLTDKISGEEFYIDAASVRIISVIKSRRVNKIADTIEETRQILVVTYQQVPTQDGVRFQSYEITDDPKEAWRRVNAARRGMDYSAN